MYVCVCSVSSPFPPFTQQCDLSPRKIRHGFALISVYRNVGHSSKCMKRVNVMYSFYRSKLNAYVRRLYAFFTGKQFSYLQRILNFSKKNEDYSFERESSVTISCPALRHEKWIRKKEETRGIAEMANDLREMQVIRYVYSIVL